MDPGEEFASPPPPLPTEILSNIFLHCVDLDGSLNAMNTIDIPLLLTSICSSWRDVAIGTQSLWSRLFLSIKPNAVHQSALVSTWLARSGAHPLQIYIIWETPPFDSSNEVLDALVQHSHHWRNMFFFIPFAAYQSLAPIRGKIPLLTELSLGTDDDLVSSPALDAFEIAPQLRSVECVHLQPDVFKLPWAHLSKIPIMAVTVEDCIDILCRATSLVNSSFIFNGSVTWPVKPVNRLHHRKLRELAILTSPWDTSVNVNKLFRLLTLSSLHSLRICNVRWPFGADILPFLSRINALESLHLRKNALSEDDLHQILRLTPSLKHFTVLLAPSDSTIMRNLLDRLIWRSNAENSLTPKLESIEFTSHGLVGITFVQLLESRWNVNDALECPRVSRLRRVNIITDEEFGEDITNRLENLAAEGMTIIIEAIGRDDTSQ